MTTSQESNGHGNEETEFLIGIDLDELLYPWCDAVREVVRYQFNKDIPHPSHYVTKPEDWGLTSWEWEYIWSEGIRQDLIFTRMNPMSDAWDFLIEAGNLGKRIIITQRPPGVEEDTLRWLDVHGLEYEEIHFLPKPGQYKSNVKPHCHVYVDDNVRVMDDILFNTRAHFILFDRPHNQRAKASFQLYNRMDRALNHDDVLIKIEYLKERYVDQG